jgi:hypothetical protein
MLYWIQNSLYWMKTRMEKMRSMHFRHLQLHQSYHLMEIFMKTYSGSVFAFQLQVYDIAAPIYDISDITNDGLLDVVYRSFENQLRFFKQNNSNGYITDYNFTYNPFPHAHQPNDVTFYDLDNDGVQELIYYLDAGTADSIWAVSNHVAKYNPAINNYELIYYHRPSPYFFTFGFAVGDFDNDGKNNFSTGSVVKKYYFYEYVDGDSIKVEHEKELETSNIFYSQMTDDMNGNGKKEVWAGSQFISTQYGGVIRVYIMEATGNESYDIIYQIDIRGMFPFKYTAEFRYVDLDGDGTKEIFFNMGSLVFCFKYSNERNFYLDFIIDTWEDDPGYTHDNLEGVDVADLDSDGTAEIIMQKYVGQPFKFKSLFWKRDKTVDVLDENSTIPEEFNLYQNYPNPFNPSTTIKYDITTTGFVDLRVYDLLGNETAVLVNEEKPPGNYTVEFNAGTLSSGVYFLKLKHAGNLQVRKMILLR